MASKCTALRFGREKPCSGLGIGHGIVGECLENEHYNAIGDSVQQTTGGLLVWRKADNWTAFTDGYRAFGS